MHSSSFGPPIEHGNSPRRSSDPIVLRQLYVLERGAPSSKHRLLALRQANPRWGKDMLTPILRREGVEVSVSMVGRILSKLKRERRLLPATGNDPCIISRPQIRPDAISKPRDYEPKAPGDLVQVDSADASTARPKCTSTSRAHDYISRWDVLGIYGRATAVTATSFLEELLARASFPVRAIQGRRRL